MPRLLLLASATFAFAGPAVSAQPASDLPEIIVEGTTEREKQIQDFVGSLTQAPIGGQLSRFDWEICPTAVGLPDAQNHAATERMRRVAVAAGMTLAEPGCRPNALLVVADNKQEFIEGLHDKYPIYFADRWGRPNKPKIQPGPATAWHVETIVDSNGNVPRRQRTLKYFISDSTDTTRLYPAHGLNMVAGVVVIDRAALEGLTTTQVADYAAMRIFARTDPARVKSNAPTILDILDAPMGSSVPVTMTEWDLGFLRALYGSQGRQHANRQRKEMQGLLRKDLTNAER
jgi:hypothetical protein